jgi:hypothetical protein
VSQKKYKAGFTAGSLLLKESEVLIASINDVVDYLKGDENLNPSLVPNKFESSQKRIKTEVDNRLKAIGSPLIINAFINADTRNKNLILFYGAAKHYAVIADFMLEIVLLKWTKQNLTLTNDDFLGFLFLKEDSHPELEKFTPVTKKKMAEVVLRMLRELGILEGNTLKKVQFNNNILKLIVLNNDRWFLDAILMGNKEKTAI